MLVGLFFSLPVHLGATTIPESYQKIGEGAAYYLAFIKVYDAELFSTENAAQEGILSADVSKCLHLEYTVGVKKRDFIEAADTIISRQVTSDQLQEVQPYITMFHEQYKDVEDGDSYTLCYESQSSTTTLLLNGTEQVSADSPDFARIYFSIWLGEKEPLDEKLREDLLSGLSNI